jgi:hypothetical protein
MADSTIFPGNLARLGKDRLPATIDALPKLEGAGKVVSRTAMEQ